MVSRDVNIRLNASKNIEKRLCFKPPTKGQKHLENLVKPRIEPLVKFVKQQIYVHIAESKGLSRI